MVSTDEDRQVARVEERVLQVVCELAPLRENSGLFWIGWTRPLIDADFRKLRRFLLCWRAVDIERYGLEGFDEGWLITGEGLEQASLLGYQIYVNGRKMPETRGNFRAELASPAHGNNSPSTPVLGVIKAPTPRDETSCELAPVLVRFLRPEIAILGADLQVYGPFQSDEVAAIPSIHAEVFFENGAAILFEG